jgi:hypothetical protein
MQYDDESGEDYIDEIKVIYENGKEETYKINELYDGLGILIEITRTAYNPMEYFLSFEDGAGGAEGYIKVGQDNQMEDTETGEVVSHGVIKNIIEENNNDIDAKGHVPEWKNINKKFTAPNPDNKYKIGDYIVYKDIISNTEKTGTIESYEDDGYYAVYVGYPVDYDMVKPEEILRIATEEEKNKWVESNDKNKNIKSYDWTKDGRRTEVKCSVKIKLGSNFDTSELVAKEYDNTIIGGDKLDIYTLASSSAEGIVDFWPIVKTNINFSDYKDEQEIIDWFKNEIVSTIMDSMEALFGNRPETVEVKDIEFVKKHGIPVSEIVEGADKINNIPEDKHLEYRNKDNSPYGIITKYDEKNDRVYFQYMFNNKIKWDMPMEEFENMLEKGDIKEVEYKDTKINWDEFDLDNDDEEKDNTEIDSEGDPIEYEYSWFITYYPNKIVLYHGGDEHETKLPAETPFKDVMKKLKEISKPDYAIYLIKKEGDKSVFIGNTSDIDNIKE